MDGQAGSGRWGAARESDLAGRLERRDLRLRLRNSTLAGLERLDRPQESAERLKAIAAEEAARLRADLRRAATLAPTHIEEACSREWEELRCHLHDTILQVLEYVAGGGFGLCDDSATIAQVARRGIDDLRAWLDAPASSEARDLLAELAQVTAEASLMAGPSIELEADAPDARGARVDADTARAVTGAVREALTNARKHADASRVVVRMDHGADGIAVTVRDDGVGIEEGTLEGLGLPNSIFRRITGAGGRARVRRASGGGTEVSLHIGGVA